MLDQAIQVGEWRADPTTNELGRAGDAVRIEPKAMEVLMLLARHAGQVVSREQLLATVWAGVVVGDEALTQSVIKLRKALGDNPRSPAYIETISKRGYRLIAPVGKKEAAPARTRAARGLRPLALLAAAAVVAAAGSAYVFHSLTRPTPLARSDADAGFAGEHAAAPLTVTVLPFEAVGAGADQDYLARGIGSDLMTDLSRLSGLRLIEAGPQGRVTTARYVVSGSVQREGATLRINVRLTDARTDEQLWAQRFERPFGDLFAIQNEIGRSVTEHLPARITEAERRRLAHRYTRSLEAYDDFLRGQALFLVRGSDENLRARAYYEKALALDPEFARAYAGLAMTYAMEYRYRRSRGASDALARAAQLAESARQIDPGTPEVYWALGFVQTQGRRYDEALASLRRAIELNPSYADAYALMGGIYTYVGEPAKSIPLLRTALRLNPDGGYLYFLLLGRAYLFENDLQQALINLREALARNPDDLEARVYLAAALVASGDRSGAEWQADQIRATEAGFSARKWLETYPMTSAPHKERLLALLAQTGL
ncbi:MAG TPA: tetratricopeptide repeat protein [Burkholderiales bacterium]|nr:tetratricopeptide repeat protein [Burkholderiales bacterium]